MRSAAHMNPDTQSATGGAHLDGGQSRDDTKTTPASGNTLLRATKLTKPIDDSPGVILPTAITETTPMGLPPSVILPLGHGFRGTHRSPAGGDLPADQVVSDTKRYPVGGEHYDDLLLIFADALDDLEHVRIAAEGRLRSLEDPKIKNRAGSPEAQAQRRLITALQALEGQAIIDLQRAMRAHPLGPWVARTVGIGEKQAARLLAAIGNPVDRTMPSQLWQYCGHGAPSKRQKGVKTFWNPNAKMRLHLIAESCMKQRTSPYRAVYDEAKAAAADRVHTAPCMNRIPPVAGKPQGSNGCGTRANPELGEIGSPWRDGHKHNHALRMVGKAILLDLWHEARTVATA